MANGYFERGEIYKVRMDYGVGVEEGAFRPGVVISSDRINNTSGLVLIAYMSRKAIGKPRTDFDVEVMATGIPSYVLCNQIAGVDKSRMMGLMGKLDYSEQKRVDDILENVFDLGYADEEALIAKDREISDRDALIAEKDKEIAELKARVAAEVAKTENLELSYKVENAMWQKLYEKALNQVVDMKYTNDLFLKNHLGREETPKAPVVVVNDPPAESPVVNDPPKTPEPEVVVVDDRPDINRCTITALKNVGFSLAVARQITTRRPYKSVADLKSVPGLKASLFRVMKPKLRCVPVEEAPEEKPPVVREPDPGYEVDPPVIPEETDEVVEVKKINVNTASAKEIAEFLGISENAGMAIVGKRKREGLFTSLEQIVHPKRFTAKALEKYRDKLTL